MWFSGRTEGYRFLLTEYRGKNYSKLIANKLSILQSRVCGSGNLMKNLPVFNKPHLIRIAENYSYSPKYNSLAQSFFSQNKLPAKKIYLNLSNSSCSKLG